MSDPRFIIASVLLSAVTVGMYMLAGSEKDRWSFLVGGLLIIVGKWGLFYLVIR